mmetsp:Transcript_3074/g.9560  ORF Transcript_3074/g.9560 Transcript_3074/m.9560 type:complete len:209 (+) Transcript_3074:1389-2015(+)
MRWLIRGGRGGLCGLASIRTLWVMFALESIATDPNSHDQSTARLRSGTLPRGVVLAARLGVSFSLLAVSSGRIASVRSVASQLELLLSNPFAHIVRSFFVHSRFRIRDHDRIGRQGGEPRCRPLRVLLETGRQDLAAKDGTIAELDDFGVVGKGPGLDVAVDDDGLGRVDGARLGVSRSGGWAGLGLGRGGGVGWYSRAAKSGARVRL